MGERTMVIVPKELDKDSKRSKFPRISIDEIPLDQKEE